MRNPSFLAEISIILAEIAIFTGNRHFIVKSRLLQEIGHFKGQFKFPEEIELSRNKVQWLMFSLPFLFGL